MFSLHITLNGIVLYSILKYYINKLKYIPKPFQNLQNHINIFKFPKIVYPKTYIWDSQVIKYISIKRKLYYNHI